MLLGVALLIEVVLAATVVPKAMPLDSLDFPGDTARVDSPASICNNKTLPTQIRLAYAGTDGMTVSWNTNQQLRSPIVYYGDKSYRLSQSASSNSSATYPTSSTYNNHVTIKGLKPDTTYYYVLGCGNWSHPLSFRTAREKGDGTPYSFAMVGDMGTMGPDGLTTTVGKGASHPLKPGERNTILALIDSLATYDFIWHVGDIAYADSWLKEEKGGFLPMTDWAGGAKVYDRILNDFYYEIEPLSNSKAYMVGPGNHEANCDNGKKIPKKYHANACLPGQNNFTGYRSHWKMPSIESMGLENFWYSWDNGMVHYIQFNTETDFPDAPDLPGGSDKENAGPFAPDGAQLAWLEADLKAVDRTKTPWIIAGGHRPWYVSGHVCKPCQAAFEDLLVKYAVDVALFGHVHLYERLTTVGLRGKADQNELNNPCAPWYIVNGAAGHYDGLSHMADPRSSLSRAGIPGVYGWSRFTVHNCTHLSTEFLASGSGEVMDTATLYKDRKCDFKQLNGSIALP